MPAPTADGPIIDQDHAACRPGDHAVWSALYRRQREVLSGRAVPQFLDGLARLGLGETEIPRFDVLNGRLRAATGFTVEAVPGLIAEREFYALLADRRFPVTRWIRAAGQLDYLEEPDLFHDLFGHVPLLVDGDFADYVQAYGRAGLAADDAGQIRHLARLYWYTVEFGLMRDRDGIRINGAGILSSRAETLFALESASPHRLGFDLERVLATRYRIDDFQECYFVVDSFADLYGLLDRDLGDVRRRLDGRPDREPGQLAATDAVIDRGSGRHHRRRPRVA